jgi:hypothetical protein
MAFQPTNNQPLGSPKHKIQLQSDLARVVYWAHLTRRIATDGIGQRSLALLQATPEVLSALPSEERRSFEDFQSEVRKKRRRNAIATAKSVILDPSFFRAQPRATTAIYYFGVIPVFELQIEFPIDLSPTEHRNVRLALVPDFPSDAKAGVLRPIGRSGTQLKLFKSNNEESDDLITLRGYCLEFYRVIECYLEEAGNVCRVLLERSSGRLLFRQVAAAREILAERIGIKLKHFRKCIYGNTALDAVEIAIGRQLVAENIEGILLAELGSYVFHTVLAAYLRLYGIELDAINQRSFVGFPQSLAARWGVTEENFTKVVEANPLLSTLYDASIRASELSSRTISGLEKYVWLTGLAELSERTAFLRDEKLDLRSVNVFLSHRTGSELVDVLLREARLAPIQSVALQTYRKPSPSENEFSREIIWHIWACTAMISDLSGGELTAGQGLHWLLRELDAAVQQRKRSIVVTCESDVDLHAVCGHVKRLTADLPAVEGLTVEQRADAMIARLDKNRRLHVEYVSSVEGFANATLKLRDWLEQTRLAAAEEFFSGLISLFSRNSQQVIGYVCSKADGRRSVSGGELSDLFHSDVSFVDVRQNLSKFPVSLDGVPINLVSHRQTKASRNSPYSYFNNFPTIVRALFPAVDLEALKSRLFSPQHTFVDLRSKRRSSG